MAEEKKEEKKETKKKVSKKDAFIARKLQIINAMPDGYKKESLAQRVLRNKEGK